MSTPLTLTVGGITLTYNTMHMGVDHGMLFQEKDRQRRRHPDLNYEDQQGHEESFAQSEMCFSRTLGALLPRLELLGYTLMAAKADYEWLCASEIERHGDYEVDTRSVPPEHLTFERFVEFTRSHPVLISDAMTSITMPSMPGRVDLRSIPTSRSYLKAIRSATGAATLSETTLALCWASRSVHDTSGACGEPSESGAGRCLGLWEFRGCWLGEE
jgi:hypothetical protein